MAISQTTRLGVYRWTASSDQFLRTHMDESHRLLEERVGGFYSSASDPSATGAQYERSFHLNTATGRLFYYSTASSSWRNFSESLSFGSPVALTMGGTTADGTAGTPARADHTHALPGYATPTATGTANAAGAATTVARSDHVHAIGTGSVQAGALAAGAVDASNVFAAGVVNSTALASGAVTAGKIGTAGISAAGQFATGVVDAAALAADAVTTVKIADTNVTTAKVADNAITAVKIATDAVTSIKIQDTAITTAKLANLAVTTAKIADASVTQAKLAATIKTITNCTSSTRPGSPAQGDFIYETDTNRIYVWNGSTWTAPGFGTAVSAPTAPSTSDHLVNKAYADSLVSGGLPPGFVGMWPTTSAPSGWLICDGTAVSRTTYSGLFAAIGTTYGSGNGSTTFNLPDWRGRAPFGYSATDTDFNAMGKTAGSKTVTLTTSNLPTHSHTLDHSHTGGTTSSDASHTHSIAHTHSSPGSTGGAGSHSHTATGGSHQHDVTISTSAAEQFGFGLTQSGSFTNRAMVQSGYPSVWPSQASGSLTLSTNDPGNHTHTVPGCTLGSGTSGAGSSHSHTFSVPSATGNTGTAGSGSAATVLSPSLAINFIIRT